MRQQKFKKALPYSCTNSRVEKTRPRLCPKKNDKPMNGTFHINSDTYYMGDKGMSRI